MAHCIGCGCFWRRLVAGSGTATSESQLFAACSSSLDKLRWRLAEVASLAKISLPDSCFLSKLACWTGPYAHAAILWQMSLHRGLARRSRTAR
ncbi:hypothetical protein KOW79_015724 [Hemibagrus wyckioides]|uniref:Uncharacterized protein n=1 Tax=Hemibagrus wyckioides TaxID=337641 RepID=A0A9D3NF72_9TELE|nr:hypothetical protein KOW79_015724 [Hemibagrus wyckioides]